MQNGMMEEENEGEMGRTEKMARREVDEQRLKDEHERREEKINDKDR